MKHKSTTVRCHNLKLFQEVQAKLSAVTGRQVPQAETLEMCLETMKNLLADDDDIGQLNAMVREKCALSYAAGLAAAGVKSTIMRDKDGIPYIRAFDPRTARTVNHSLQKNYVAPEGKAAEREDANRRLEDANRELARAQPLSKAAN